MAPAFSTFSHLFGKIEGGLAVHWSSMVKSFSQSILRRILIHRANAHRITLYCDTSSKILHDSAKFMTTAKPKVFISSTIYDFRDLRSALKYWLEELGYDVYLSEQNDFPIASDKNSYESCFHAIDQCDYFILLVGARVGGWYDKESRTSITQAEYRRAYKKLTEGTIKILAFVRKELWDVREDRKELQRLLENEEFQSIEPDQKTAIARHPSKFVEDADFIFSFIEEIGRHDEMKKSIQDKTALPIGNWIYTFNGFEDIINSLERMFGVKSNLNQKKMLFCLKKELVHNLSIILLRCDEETIAPIYTTTDVVYHREIKNRKFQQETIPLLYEDISRITFFTILAFRARFSNQFTEKAILEGTYLEYDNNSHKYVETPLRP